MFANSIQHLRLRGQPAALRPLQAWLACSDIAPPALPSTAILLVRQLQARGNWVGQQPQQDWSLATRAVLERLLQAAARPANGAVPADARAVLFADQAELLACLCRDWLAGQLYYWWWRCLFPAGIDGARLSQQLQQQARWLPQLLRRLHCSRQAAPLLLALPQPALYQLWCELCHVYALPDWPAALPQPSALAGVLSAACAPPWQAYLAPDSGLPSAAQMLLGTALQLASDAAGVRQPEFAAALAGWWQQQGDRAPWPSPGVASGLAARSPGAPGFIAEVAVSPTHPDATTAPQGTASAVAGLGGGTARQCLPLPESNATPATACAGQIAPAPSATLRASSPSDASVVNVTGGAPLAPILTPAAASLIATDYGGLFYLVNLALSLQLYGDFSQPRRPGIALPLWDWLALIGERILGRQLRDDAVWPLLAQLAGRLPEHEPGSGCIAPADWQLPPDWLGWLDGKPLPAFATLSDWLDWLVPLLLARLAHALECPVNQVGALLCRQRAQLEVSEGRLDVHLKLDELQIEIRIAGLDRDPGWLPAVGCELRFHFQV